MKNKSKIKQEFRTTAAAVLGESHGGLSTTQVIEETCKYAAQFGVQVRHTSVPSMGKNKRTLLAENLQAFSDEQVFVVIRGLCEHSRFATHPNEDVERLKIRLIEQYSDLAAELMSEELDAELVEDTLLWLKEFPKAKEYFVAGLQKFNVGIFNRNTLDDMRFALEQFLRTLLGNSKPLEKQIQDVGAFIKSKGGSKQFCNMLYHVIACYKDYQNDASKHDDNYIEPEVASVIEITASLMKHLVRLSNA